MVKRYVVLGLITSIAYANIPFYNRCDTHEIITFLRQFINPGDLVFDVGANKGKKTELYLALGAHIVCFEPQIDCMKVLKNRFNNSRERVIFEHIGLADKEGVLEFYQCSSANTISTFSKDWIKQGRFAERNFKWDKKINVPVSTLDNMIAKYGKPQFCKIDVENFEYEVLKGLSCPITYLSFECNIESIEKTKKCIEHLESLGYRKFNFAMGERGWFFFDMWLDGKTLIDKLLAEESKANYDDIWGIWGDIYAHYE